MIWRPHSARQPGQSLVEFALILPILVYLLLGAIDLVTLARDDSTLVVAARQASRIVVAAGLSASNSDAQIFSSITSTLTAAGMSLGGLQSVTIYRDNTPDVGGTDPVTATTQGINLAASNVVLFTNGTPGAPSPATYLAATRVRGDYVGASIVYHFTGATAFFAAGVQIHEGANGRIDPANVSTILATAVPTPTPNL